MNLPKPANDIGPAVSQRSQEKSPLWLITMTDLMGLILAFFVLLYAMVIPVPPTWQAMKDSFTHRLKKIENLNIPLDQSQGEVDRVAISSSTDLGYFETILNLKLQSLASLSSAKVIAEPGQLRLRISATKIFLRDQVIFQSAASRDIAQLGELFSGLKNRVEIYGPAAITPMAPGPAGWTLSLHRAEAFARALREGGQDLSYAAFGRFLQGVDEIEIVIHPNREG